MINTAMRSKQRGISFGGFIFGAFFVVALALFGFKLIPAYMENAKIQHVFDTIAHDPEMQKADARELKMSFDRRASVDAINAIHSDDIELSRGEDGRPILTASYAVKVKVGGNVSLYMDFNPTSVGK